MGTVESAPRELQVEVKESVPLMEYQKVGVKVGIWLVDAFKPSTKESPGEKSKVRREMLNMKIT